MDVNQNHQFVIPEEYVLFIEGEAYPKVNKTIRDDYLLINNEFKSSEEKLLLYPNGILQHADHLKHEYTKLLRYYHPNFTEEQTKLEVDKFFSLVWKIANKSIDLNRFTKNSLNLPNGNGLPYFVTTAYKGNRYHYYDPSLGTNPREWAFEVANLWRKETFFNVDEPDEPRLYDPDEDFTYRQISWEAEKAIKQLGKAKAYNLMINLFGILANECGIDNQTIKQLTAQSPHLSYLLNPKDVVEANRTSKLVIDTQYRILLPGYNNLEIKMPTLSKVVYFLFLRHPEGLLFKQLIDYRHEVFHLYNRITNRANMEEMIRSVDALLDPTSNSINEKCSRIKEAFVSVILL